MSNDDKATLATIEALLVRDLVSVRDALEAAYQLGRITGGLEMARIGENVMQEALAKVLPT